VPTELSTDVEAGLQEAEVHADPVTPHAAEEAFREITRWRGSPRFGAFE